MGDVGPESRSLQILRLERQRAQMATNELDCLVRLAEIDDQKKSLTENVKETRAALGELDAEIAALKEA